MTTDEQQAAARTKAAEALPTIAKYTGGGALVGGGMAALAALIKHLTIMNKDRKNQVSDDDVLYLNLGQNKQAGVNGREALMSYIGAILAGYMGYRGVNKLYDNYRDQTLRKDLDRSQNAYLGQLQTQKEARFGPSTRLSAAAQGVPLVIAIGAAIAANRMLDKQYPKPKTKDFKPRRIVIKGQEGPGMEKHVPVESDVGPNEVEGLARTVLEDQKRASVSGLNDVLNSIASGNGRELRQVVREQGLEAGYKYASSNCEQTTDLRRDFAFGVLANDTLLKTAFGPMLAAEFADMSPGFMKIASAIDPQTQDLIAGVAGEFAANNRAASLCKVCDIPELHKQASETKQAMTEGLLDTLAWMALRGPKNAGTEEDAPTQDTLGQSPSRTSDDKDVMSSDQDADPYVDLKDPKAEEFYDSHKDLIDDALALNN